MIKEFEDLKREFEQLPEKKQRELTESWLEEIRWSIKFENSQSELEFLANEAMAEYRSGKTKKF